MTDIASILPNLSIGVVSVVALGYVTLNYNKTMNAMQERYIKTLEDRADKHEESLTKRETAMRGLETSVRNSMAEQLTKNTVALSEVAQVLGRVVRHLNKDL